MRAATQLGEPPPDQLPYRAVNALHTVAWALGIIYATIPSYWLIVHPRARAWARRGGKRLAVIGPVWPLLWIATGVVTWPWRRTVWYAAGWTWAPAAVLIVAGIIIYGFARQDFSTDQVLGRAELEPERHAQRLNTHGIRGRLRHPYYLGHLCELLGWTIGTGLVVLYALTAFAVLTGAYMIRAEDGELEARFGDAYREYRARVPALLPRLRA
jgi:protein-S-isoprenylcysteine O-methyltransferase Ste14